MAKSRFEKEAEIAANWWKNNIGVNAKQNNGDEFASLFMLMNSLKVRITDEQKNEFSGVLKQYVQQELERLGRVYLSVDYGPDSALAAAADISGISYAAFPVKTSMWIYEGNVQVACGYGAEAKEIYSAEQTQPQPGQQ